jgi:diadenosine tetraphosphate (Ap4A) HIT family hydrolase
VRDDICPFCSVPEHEVIVREGRCFAIWTGEQPVGSAMVLPAEHRGAPWELSDDEWVATRRLVRSVVQRVTDLYEPQGWNVGWNVGDVGGQSVPHAHCHVVPRYADEPYAGRGLRWWFKHPDNNRPT